MQEKFNVDEYCSAQHKSLVDDVKRVLEEKKSEGYVVNSCNGLIDSIKTFLSRSTNIRKDFKDKFSKDKLLSSKKKEQLVDIFYFLVNSEKGVYS